MKKGKIKRGAQSQSPSRPPQAVPGIVEQATALARRNTTLIGAVGAVAALAGAALFNRASAQRAEEANPPQGKFVEIDGTRLHYVDRGSGRPVVLLHGNGMMIEDWQASGVFDRAVAGHRVIAFDRPGFGHSDRPRSTVWTPAAQAAAIHAALAEMGVERPIVVGHSWGALVALAMALDFPEDVSGLVLLSGYYFATARPDVLLFSPPAIPIVGDAMRHTISPLVGRVISPLMERAMFAPRPVAPSFADFPIAMTMRPSQMRATSEDTAMMVPSAGALSLRYSELAMPVVIVAGDGDQITHFDRHAQRMQEVILGSELRKIAGAGHMFHYAAPEAVIEAIDRVADRSAPAEALAGLGKAARADEIVPRTAEASF